MRRALLSMLATISLLFIVAAATTPSLAADYGKVGVTAGDWVDYSVKYYSTSPSQPESEYISQYHNRVHVDILRVMGTTVTLNVTMFYPNQRAPSEAYNVDISRSLCCYLSVAGLNKGDPAHIGANIAVEDTIYMTIMETQRNVNIIEPSAALDAQVILYFDQTTGILVESHRSSLMFGWMVEKVTSTSVILSPQIDPVTGLVTVVASVSIVAMISIALAILDRKRRDSIADSYK